LKAGASRHATPEKGRQDKIKNLVADRSRAFG